MAFKMKGFSPFTKRQDNKRTMTSNMKDKTVVPASKHEENKGTEIAKEHDSKAEKINDLEDRIEFLQSDIADGGEAKMSDGGNYASKVKAQLAKLQQELARLRGE